MRFKLYCIEREFVKNNDLKKIMAFARFVDLSKLINEHIKNDKRAQP